MFAPSEATAHPCVASFGVRRHVLAKRHQQLSLNSAPTVVDQRCVTLFDVIAHQKLQVTFMLVHSCLEPKNDGYRRYSTNYTRFTTLLFS
jgi:hypothetical protein